MLKWNGFSNMSVVIIEVYVKINIGANILYHLDRTNVYAFYDG